MNIHRVASRVIGYTSCMLRLRKVRGNDVDNYVG